MEDNKKVAMICFASGLDEVPEGQMSHLARLICTAISIICLALTLLVYIMLPNLRDLQVKKKHFSHKTIKSSFNEILGKMHDVYYI